MSVMNQPYAVPGRVLAVYRTVLALPGRLTDVELANLMAPEALQKEKEAGRDMVTETVKECVKMRLLTRADGRLTPAPGLAREVLALDTVDQHLPRELARLLLTLENDANRDLALSLAWYLAQDAYSAPGNWSDAQPVLREQLGDGDFRKRTGLTNSDPYNMMEYWAGYLGFARTLSRREQEVNFPDPTAYLGSRLAELVPGKSGLSHSLAGVMEKLARLCPIFEDGEFRRAVEKEITGVKPRERDHLSSTTALAWFRLQEEGEVVLLPDADPKDRRLLPDGRAGVKVVSLVRRPDRKKGGKSGAV
jgi:hypothetical protein